LQFYNHSIKIEFIIILRLICASDIDPGGMDGNVEDDSDSIGNMRNTRPLSGAGFTLSGKEKRKPFFKKVPSL